MIILVIISRPAFLPSFLQVLSIVQVARYMVASYPMGPDTLSLMTCLAQQGNEPSTAELLGLGRPTTAAGHGAVAAAVLSPPLCAAGDLRQALTQPLSQLHRRQQQLPAVVSGAAI